MTPVSLHSRSISHSGGQARSRRPDRIARSAELPATPGRDRHQAWCCCSLPQPGDRGGVGDDAERLPVAEDHHDPLQQAWCAMIAGGSVQGGRLHRLGISVRTRALPTAATSAAAARRYHVAMGSGALRLRKDA